jgi:endonuclease/exonuclease/phosphatase family metal-dependent hydrolase
MGWARRLGVAAALVGALATGVVAWLRTQLWDPTDVRPAPVVCAADAPTLPRGQTVKVLVWNVQFAGTRKYEFFYDGGKQVKVPEADVRASLDAIAQVIREQDPDIVMLQEIDRGSDRTARVDEHAELLSRLAYPCSTSTPYHQVAYVPHPAFEHMGRVNMHLSVFSRYRIDAATRTQLPLLVEPWWRQVFNIRRALLDVDLPLVGGGRFHVFNTHLSAFSNGDGTLDRQVAVLDSVLTRAALAGDAFVIGGDLNSLPPGDDASRLGPFAHEYPEPVTPVKRLFDRYASVIPAQVYAAEPERWRTYLPFGAAKPDRTLDYAFTSRDVGVGEASVVQSLDVSDHLPLVFQVTVE